MTLHEKKDKMSPFSELVSDETELLFTDAALFMSFHPNSEFGEIFYTNSVSVFLDWVKSKLLVDFCKWTLFASDLNDLILSMQFFACKIHLLSSPHFLKKENILIL